MLDRFLDIGSSNDGENVLKKAVMATSIVAVIKWLSSCVQYSKPYGTLLRWTQRVESRPRFEPVRVNRFIVD